MSTRDPTPEELAKAEEMHAAGLIRPAPSRDHPKVTEYAIAVEMDRAGLPCACDDRAACALHLNLDGRRRHHRPGNYGDRRGGGLDKGPPQVPPEPDPD